MLLHSIWLLGDGKSIYFWTDKWLESSVLDILNIPTNIHDSLKATVGDFIRNNAWEVPSYIYDKSPYLKRQIMKICIPTLPWFDKLVWYSTTSGDLSFK